MHSFLSIPVSAIPEETKNNMPTYDKGYFSNDGSQLLIDDAHPDETFAKWLGMISDEQGCAEKIAYIRSLSTPYSKEQFQEELNNPESIWYSTPTGEING